MSFASTKLCPNQTVYLLSENKGSHSVFLQSLGGLRTLVVIVRGRCRSGLSASLNHIRQVLRILDGQLAPSVSLESTCYLLAIKHMGDYSSLTGNK